jgi:hypothetical protein
MYEIILRYKASVSHIALNSSNELTEMIHNMRFTPLRPMWSRPLSSNTSQSSIKQQVINLLSANLIKRLLRKRLDTLQIIQLQRKNSDPVRFAVKLELIVSFLCILGVACAEDDSVWLALAEELLDCFEALKMLVFLTKRWGLKGLRCRMKHRLLRLFLRGKTFWRVN